MVLFHTQHHALVFGVTTAVSFFVYLYTLSPTIAGGDSGELVAEGCQLGTSHPPGYPLYTIIVYLATTVGRYVLPGKSPAFCVNLTSAIFGSIASGLLSSSILYMIGIKEGRNSANNKVKTSPKVQLKKKGNKRQEGHPRSNEELIPVQDNDDECIMDMYIGIFMGLLHTFSPLAWQYSVTAEVFALHNLFIALIVHTTLRFAIYGRMDLLLLGAFLCGLALTNQHISVLLSIPLIMWVLHVTKLWLPIQQKDKLCVGKVELDKERCVLFMLAGLSFISGFVVVYLTMPLFSFMFPHPGSWGDVISFGGFIRHFTRKDYGSLKLYSGNDNGSENTWERFILWVRDFMWSQTFPFVGVASIIACKDAFLEEIRKRYTDKKKRKYQDRDDCGVIRLNEADSIGVDTAIILSLAFFLVVFHTLANLPLKNPLFYGIHQRFWMHPNYLCFLLGGVGFRKLCVMFAKGSDVSTKRRFCQSMLVMLLAYASRKGFKMSDHSNNVYMRNYARSILETLPRNSILFINYDQQWTSIRYMQECEGLRKDITSINLSMMSYEWWNTKRKLYPNINFPGTHYSSFHKDGFNFAQLLDANHAFDGKAFIGGSLTYNDGSYSRLYDEVPHGIVRRIIKRGTDQDITAAAYLEESTTVWQVIAREHSEGLPSLSKYGPDTWEWTVRREFFEHFVSRAAHLLDLAVSREEKSDYPTLKSLVEACAWFEAARLNDDISKDSPAVWKNLGLAYMNIVRSNENVYPIVDNLFQNTEIEFLLESIDDVWWKESDKVDWKTWASMKWEKSWATFLGMEAAKTDSSFEQVKSIYDSVLESIQRKRAS